MFNDLLPGEFTRNGKFIVNHCGLEKLCISFCRPTGIHLCDHKSTAAYRRMGLKSV